MEFVIGTTNKAKIAAAKAVLEDVYEQYELTAMQCASGVKEQPFGDEETVTGAINRAKAASTSKSQAIGIGFEGGVRELKGQVYVCNWGALALPTGEVFTAGGALIPLPDEIANQLRNGQELGPVVESYFAQQNIRQTSGAMGMFTDGMVSRSELFIHIMMLLIGQYQYATKQLDE